MPRPTRDQLAAADGATIPDVIGTGLDILFCGINPGLYSGYTGWHFARPGNRFWPSLHRAGLTPRLLDPSEQHLLPELGLGITNLVDRASVRADELDPAELREGGARLTERVAAFAPRALAVLGITAYRQAFGRRHAAVGPQDDRVAGVPVWVLPNPSGLNAHYDVDGIAAAMARVRDSLPDARPGAPSAQG